MMVIIVKGSPMAGDVRDRMIDGAIRLLAQQGLQATSFAEVLELTGAPRGSVYHHFPGGKDQLVGAAVDRAGARALHALDGKQGASAEELTTVFLALWRELLVRSDCGAGCAVLAVTGSHRLPGALAACRSGLSFLARRACGTVRIRRAVRQGGRAICRDPGRSE
jgi:AcrR family transcriptional regulator